MDYEHALDAVGPLDYLFKDDYGESDVYIELNDVLIDLGQEDILVPFEHLLVSKVIFVHVLGGVVLADGPLRGDGGLLHVVFGGGLQELGG